MGQKFINNVEKIDASKLNEGMRVKIETWQGTLSGSLTLETTAFGQVWAVITDVNKIKTLCHADDGRTFAGILSVELLDIEDPADKIQAEHAEMLGILEDISDAPWSNGDVRNMARDFLEKRKAQQ